MGKIGTVVTFLFALGCLNYCTSNSSSGSSTVSLTVQNNMGAPVTNLKVGTVTYGTVASGATTSAKSISAGSQSVTSDSGQNGSVTIPDKTSATMVISNAGVLSVQ
jgi:hypothetical protein